MLRSITAVLAGYVTFAIPSSLLVAISGRDPYTRLPADVLAIFVLLGMFFAFGAGYVAARMARKKPTGHASAVAFLIALGGIVSLALVKESTGWVQIAAVFLMAPAAVAGGYFRSRSPEAEE